jgi:hypothetical protein
MPDRGVPPTVDGGLSDGAKEAVMTRFLVEGRLPEGMDDGDAGDAVRRAIAAGASVPGIRWLQSSLAVDGSRFFCEFEAVDEATVHEAVRRAAIPCDVVTPVRELSARAYTDSSF